MSLFKMEKRFDFKLAVWSWETVDRPKRLLLSEMRACRTAGSGVSDIRAPVVEREREWIKLKTLILQQFMLPIRYKHSLSSQSLSSQRPESEASTLTCHRRLSRAAVRIWTEKWWSKARQRCHWVRIRHSSRALSHRFVLDGSPQMFYAVWVRDNVFPLIQVAWWQAGWVCGRWLGKIVVGLMPSNMKLSKCVTITELRSIELSSDYYYVERTTTYTWQFN